tara:strand:- start:149 stop:376 length:228 start_codon:yes stop_codon:yes gene_type:complete
VNPHILSSEKYYLFRISILLVDDPSNIYSQKNFFVSRGFWNEKELGKEEKKVDLKRILGRLNKQSTKQKAESLNI